MKLNIISKLHHSTKRDYLSRMNDNKVECMKVARKFGKSFFDGERRFGYGGYKYDGRFKAVAEILAEVYNLDSNSDILDFGCGKGFLMYELNKLLKLKNRCIGVDVSSYAAKHAYKDIGKDIVKRFPSKTFDLIISLGTLHNFTLPSLYNIFGMFDDYSYNQFVTVDSYRNEQELFNLQCWTLTAEQFLRPEEWEFIFSEFGYAGDYEYLFFT